MLYQLIKDHRRSVCRLFLLLMLGTAWFNSLNLKAFRLSMNPLLIPALLVGFILVMDWFFSYLKDNKQKQHLFFIPMILGIVPLSENESWLLRLPRLMYMVFFVSSVSSLLYGYPITTDFIVRLAIFFLIMIVLPAYPELNRPEYLSLGVRSLAILSGLSGLFAFYTLVFKVKYEIEETIIGLSNKGVSGLYSNANQAAIVSALGLFAALYLLRIEKHRIVRIVAVISVIIQMVIIVFSNSRTSLLSILLAFVIYLILFAVRRKRVDSTVLIVTIGFLILFVGVRPYVNTYHFAESHELKRFGVEDMNKELEKIKNNQRTPQIQKTPQIKSEIPLFYFKGPVPKSEVELQSPILKIGNRLLSGRLQLAKEAILLWRTKPITGYGFRHFYEAYLHEVGPNGYLINGKFGSSHNLFVDLFWMGGVVGFALGLAFTILLLKSLYFSWYKLNNVSVKKLFYTLVFLFFFLTQMLEVTIITTFSIYTMSFWAMLPGVVRLNDSTTKQSFSESAEVENCAKI